MNEIRIGRVSSVNYDSGSIDVIFPDEEENVYVDCPLMSCEYQMPKVNDMVTVIFQTNSDGADQGYVIGVPFTEENQPEVKGKNVYFKRFSKDAYIMFDPDTESLVIHAPKVIIDNLM